MVYPYLPPTTNPVEADAFVDLLCAAVVGITGLPGSLVRPSWQPDPPMRPPRATNWAGVRVANMVPDDDPVLTTTNTGTILDRFENGDLQVSMYGPLCTRYAALLRDGLQVPFNREVLRSQGIATGREGPIAHVPELIDDVWYDRADVSFTITREIRRTYSILTFVSASGVIHGHGPDPTINVPFSVHQ